LPTSSPISQTQIENFFAGIDQDGKEVEEYTKFKDFICESEEISGEFRRLKRELESKISNGKKNQSDMRKLLLNNSQEVFSWKDTLVHGILSILYSGSQINIEGMNQDGQHRRIQSHTFVNSLHKRLMFLDEKLQLFEKLKKWPSSIEKSLKCATSIIDLMEQSGIINKQLQSQGYKFMPNFYWLSKKAYVGISSYSLFGVMPLSEVISPKKAPLISSPCEFIVRPGGKTYGGHPHIMFDESVSDFLLTAITSPINSKSQLKFNNQSRLTFDENSIAIKSINKIQSMKWQYNLDFLEVIKKIKFDEESLDINVNLVDLLPENQDKVTEKTGNEGYYASLSFKHSNMLKQLDVEFYFLKIHKEAILKEL